MRTYLICLLFLFTACQSVPGEIEASTPIPPTNTAELVSLNAGVPTNTPSPTNTPEPTQTFTPIPTITPPATPTAVPTFTPSSEQPQIAPLITPTSSVDRTCPDAPPEKPEYEHTYLSGSVWPAPDTTVARPHFWLSDPVQGGRKPLENGYYPYGWDGNGRFLLHNGSDFPKWLGTPVTAVAAGTVIVAQSDDVELYGWRCGWYGQLVVLELAERWQERPVYMLYGHVQNLQVEPGQPVEGGDILAEVGVEGVSLVPHLHLEVRIGNNSFASTVNPMLWLKPLPETGLLAGRLVDSEGRPWQGTRVTLIDASGEAPQFLNTFTYLDDPQHLINPDAGLAENFVFADLRPGNYTLFATLQGEAYRLPVEIQEGKVTAVEIITKPYQEVEE